MRIILLSFSLFLLLCKLHADETAVVLVRHGESRHNLENLCNSNPEHPAYQVSDLTEQGRRQVAFTAQELIDMGYKDSNISIVYVSPLPRTLQTAEILAEAGLFSKDKIVIDPRITEIQFGDAEGMNYRLISREAFWWQYHGESDVEIDSRVQSFYEDTLKQHQGDHVIVVSHGHILRKVAEQISDDQVVIEPGRFAVRPVSP